MSERKTPLRKGSALEMLVLRDRLGLGRYRKTSPRDPEEERVLLDLALAKIRKAEANDYVLLGFRRRRVNFASGD